jgi:hypothetical protein
MGLFDRFRGKPGVGGEAVQYLATVAFEVAAKGVSPPKGARDAQRREFLDRLRQGCSRAVQFRADWKRDAEQQFAAQGFPGMAAALFKDPVDQVLPGWFSLAALFESDKMDSDYGIQAFHAFFSRVAPRRLHDGAVIHFGDLIKFDTFCGLLLRSRFVADLAYVARQLGPDFEAPGLLPHPIRFLRADQRDGHLIARIFSLPVCAELRGSVVCPDEKAGVDWIIDDAVKGTGWRKG